MERSRCGLDSSHASTHQCMCVSPPLLLCADCVKVHVTQTGEHLVTKQPNTAADLEPGTACHVCKDSVADVFCCCRFPATLLCVSCQSSHLQGSDSHLLLPLAYRQQVTTNQAAAQLLERLLSLTKAKDQIQSCVEVISACQQEVQAKGDYLVACIGNYVQSQVRVLEAIKAAARRRIEKAAESAKTQLLAAESEGDLLTKELWACAQGKEDPQFALFQYDARDWKGSADLLVGVQWKSRVQPNGEVTEEFEYSNARGEETTQTSSYQTEENDLLQRSKQETECLKVAESVLSECLYQEADPSSALARAKSEFQRRCEALPKSITSQYQPSLEKSLDEVCRSKSALEIAKRTLARLVREKEELQQSLTSLSIERSGRTRHRVRRALRSVDICRAAALLTSSFVVMSAHDCGAVRWFFAQILAYLVVMTLWGVLRGTFPLRVKRKLPLWIAVVDVAVCGYAMLRVPSWSAECTAEDSVFVLATVLFMPILLLSKAALSLAATRLVSTAVSP